MSNIHPTAVIEEGAHVADDAVIGPMCYVGAKASVGPGCRLVSHVTVLGRTTLGRRNVVWPQATLGADPQDLKFHGEDSELIIGDYNEIRENVTIHKGTVNGGNFTRVGDHNLIMVGSHIAHDCIIGSHIVLSNGVQLAGHVKIENHVVIAGISGVHHFVTIGAHAFVGGMTRIVHDVPPYMIVEGNPSKVRGVNAIGLERNHTDPKSITRLKEAYRRLFRGLVPDGEEPGNSVSQALERLEDAYAEDQCIGHLISFLRNSSNGVYGRYLEKSRRDNRHANPAR